MPVILASWRPRQKGHEFEASLDFLSKKKKMEVDEALEEHPFLYPWTFAPLLTPLFRGFPQHTWQRSTQTCTWGTWLWFCPPWQIHVPGTLVPVSLSAAYHLQNVNFHGTLACLGFPSSSLILHTPGYLPDLFLKPFLF